MKTTERLPFSSLAPIPDLVKDFLAGKIMPEILMTPENLRERAAERKEAFSTAQREVLSEVLQQQMGPDLHEAQRQNLQLLKAQGTCTVTTGHQLNLFTGPVFFIYKIVQTIKTAAVLTEELGIPAVPVFWMATEDHDFEEIDHFRTENNIYSITGKSGGAVGRIEVTDTSFITEFEKEFGAQPFGDNLIQLAREAYRRGETFSAATRILVNYLFADRGLLILDGDDAGLKVQMKSFFRDEMLHNSLYKTTSSVREQLEKQYGKVQVNPREINLFYLSETRNRIEKVGEKYQVLDTQISFTEHEILAELERFPERFSPNAVLRPLYQETVLPNIAYIGGNAEIMYWLELPEYFKYSKTEMPVLVPRNSMLWVEENLAKKIRTSGLSFKDYVEGWEEKADRNLMAESPLLPLLIQNEKTLQENFRNLKEQASLTDKTFRNLVEAEEKRQLKSYTRMRKRLLRAERLSNAAKMEKLQRLSLQLHPGGTWQERVLNFSVFYARYGAKWLNTCYHETDPYKSELIILEY